MCLKSYRQFTSPKSAKSSSLIFFGNWNLLGIFDGGCVKPYYRVSNACTTVSPRMNTRECDTGNLHGYFKALRYDDQPIVSIAERPEWDYKRYLVSLVEQVGNQRQRRGGNSLRRRDIKLPRRLQIRRTTMTECPTRVWERAGWLTGLSPRG